MTLILLFGMTLGVVAIVAPNWLVKGEQKKRDKRYDELQQSGYEAYFEEMQELETHRLTDKAGLLRVWGIVLVGLGSLSIWVD
jgi:hypothetical protein